jgi:hypothetical protein
LKEVNLDDADAGCLGFPRTCAVYCPGGKVTPAAKRQGDEAQITPEERDLEKTG